MTRKMKNSGIEWCDTIPSSWNVLRLKYVMNNYDSQRMPIDAGKRSQVGDVLYDYYGASGIIDSIDGYTHTGRKILIGEDGANLLLRNLPLIYIADGKYWVNNHAHILSPKYGWSLDYFAHQMEIIDYFKYITGSAQPKLSQGNLNKVYLLVPSIKEQIQIATYLNTKCTEIATLAADIQSEIETLEAYKRSLITEAVTKGLDKNVAMKDSGVEWLGEIPKTWCVHPVYVYFRERINKNLNLNERNLLSLSYGKIIRKDIDTVGGLLPASFSTYNIVEAGDIIIRPTDLQNDKRSLRTGLVKEKGIITSAYIALKSIKKVNSGYYYYLLHSFDIQKVFYNMGNGVRQNLNYNEFSKLMVLVPSYDEQNSIVEYLNARCSEIDIIIAEKQEQLSILSEYKKSIIYEYVTGKKEVPVP